MKVKTCVLGLMLLVVIFPTSHAETSLRCGSSIISVGDSKADVLLKCGEPMLKETVGEKEESRRVDIPLTSESSDRQSSAAADNSDPAVVRQKESITKTIEQWTYNQGSGTFLRILIFEGGELVQITMGNRM
jgi:hypothetical protein